MLPFYFQQAIVSLELLYLLLKCPCEAGVLFHLYDSVLTVNEDTNILAYRASLSYFK